MYVVNQTNQETGEEETQNSAEPIFENTEAVKEINVNANQKVKLTKDNEEWIVEDASRKVDQERVEQFTYALMNISGQPVNVSKEDVGLAFPKVTVVLVTDEENKQRMSVGQLHSSEEYYYVEHIEDKEIYLVERTVIETIPLSTVSLLDNKILSISSEDVEKINIDNGTEKIELSKESPYSEDEALAHISGWYINAPYEGVYSVAFSKMSEVIYGVDMLQQTETIEENATDLESYGLSNSDFSITLTSDDAEETLVIGNPAKDQQYYAMVEGEDTVYTIETAALDPFSYQAFDLVDHFVHIVAVDVLDELTIETEEESVKLNIAHEKKEEEITSSITYEGEKVALETFQEIYKLIAGLSFDEELTEQVEKSESEVTLHYKLGSINGNDSETTVELVPISDERYAVFKQDVADFSISKDEVHQMIETVKEMLPN